MHPSSSHQQQQLLRVPRPGLSEWMDSNLNHSLADRTSENERRDSNPSSEVTMTAELNRCDPRECDKSELI